MNIKRYECYNCGKKFNNKDLKDNKKKIQFLFCPFCQSENVEDKQYKK